MVRPAGFRYQEPATLRPGNLEERLDRAAMSIRELRENLEEMQNQMEKRIVALMWEKLGIRLTGFGDEQNEKLLAGAPEHSKVELGEIVSANSNPGSVKTEMQAEKNMLETKRRRRDRRLAVQTQGRRRIQKITRKLGKKKRKRRNTVLGLLRRYWRVVRKLPRRQRNPWHRRTPKKKTKPGNFLFINHKGGFRERFLDGKPILKARREKIRNSMRRKKGRLKQGVGGQVLKNGLTCIFRLIRNESVGPIVETWRRCGRSHRRRLKLTTLVATKRKTKCWRKRRKKHGKLGCNNQPTNAFSHTTPRRKGVLIGLRPKVPKGSNYEYVLYTENVIISENGPLNCLRAHLNMVGGEPNRPEHNKIKRLSGPENWGRELIIGGLLTIQSQNSERERSSPYADSHNDKQCQTTPFSLGLSSPLFCFSLCLSFACWLLKTQAPPHPLFAAAQKQSTHVLLCFQLCSPWFIFVVWGSPPYWFCTAIKLLVYVYYGNLRISFGAIRLGLHVAGRVLSYTLGVIGTDYGRDVAEFLAGDLEEYCNQYVDTDALLYLIMAKEILHALYPNIIIIAEEATFFSGLCESTLQGGLGFDYYVNLLLVPEMWSAFLESVPDHEWSMSKIVNTLIPNREFADKMLRYVENHNHSIPGRRLYAEILFGRVDEILEHCKKSLLRGSSLHKMIRLIPLKMGGWVYLNFMGNEFRHLQRVESSTSGNDFSGSLANCQWDLLEKYGVYLLDKDMMKLAENVLSRRFPNFDHVNNSSMVIFYIRCPFVVIFNFHPTNSYDGYNIHEEEVGEYQGVLFFITVKLRLIDDADKATQLQNFIIGFEKRSAPEYERSFLMSGYGEIVIHRTRGAWALMVDVDKSRYHSEGSPEATTLRHYPYRSLEDKTEFKEAALIESKVRVQGEDGLTTHNKPESKFTRVEREGG